MAHTARGALNRQCTRLNCNARHLTIPALCYPRAAGIWASPRSTSRACLSPPKQSTPKARAGTRWCLFSYAHASLFTEYGIRPGVLSGTSGPHATPRHLSQPCTSCKAVPAHTGNIVHHRNRLAAWTRVHTSNAHCRCACARRGTDLADHTLPWALGGVPSRYTEKGDDSEMHILIFDECDAIFRVRGENDGSAASKSYDSVVNALLTKMDGLTEIDNIVVIGLTNRKELLDPALLRPVALNSVCVCACTSSVALAQLRAHACVCVRACVCVCDRQTERMRERERGRERERTRENESESERDREREGGGGWSE